MFGVSTLVQWGSMRGLAEAARWRWRRDSLARDVVGLLCCVTIAGWGWRRMRRCGGMVGEGNEQRASLRVADRAARQRVAYKRRVYRYDRASDFFR